MKGLILKDFYSLMNLYKKNLIILFALYAAMVIFSRFVFMISIFTWMMGFYSLSSFSLDEKSGWDRYVRTLPVGEGQIIAGKYLITLMFIAAGLVFSVFIELVNLVLYNSAIDFTTISFVAPLTIITMSIMIPCAIKWGLEKARYTFMLSIALIYALPILLKNLLPDITTRLANMIEAGDNIKRFSFSLFIIAIGAYIVSYIISCRIYEKKEF